MKELSSRGERDSCKVDADNFIGGKRRGTEFPSDDRHFLRMRRLYSRWSGRGHDPTGLLGHC